MMTFLSSIAFTLLFSLPHARVPATAIEIQTLSTPSSVSIKVKIENPTDNMLQIRDIAIEMPDFAAFTSAGGFFSISSSQVAGFGSESIGDIELFLLRPTEEVAYLEPGASLTLSLGQLVGGAELMHQKIGAISVVTDAGESKWLLFPMLYTNAMVEASGKVSFRPELRYFRADGAQDSIQELDGDTYFVKADGDVDATQTCNNSTDASNACTESCPSNMRCHQSGTMPYTTTLKNCVCL